MRALMPILEWLPSYRRAWLPGDLVAGAAVWAVLVPLALAYAGILGVDPVVGLYTLPLPLVALVERVYGRLSPEEIGSLFSAHFADCITGVADKVDLGGKNGRNGLLRTAKGLKSLPRGGIEPPTRGFSVPGAEWPSPRSSKRKRDV